MSKNLAVDRALMTKEFKRDLEFFTAGIDKMLAHMKNDKVQKRYMRFIKRLTKRLEKEEAKEQKAEQKEAGNQEEQENSQTREPDGNFEKPKAEPYLKVVK